MGARVRVDGGTPIEPSDGADQQVEAEHDAEREEDQEEEKAVRGAPKGQPRNVEPDVVLQQRVGHAVGHTLPPQHDSFPPLRCPRADQQAQQGAGPDHDA